jgi:hypothetical protein
VDSKQAGSGSSPNRSLAWDGESLGDKDKGGDSCRGSMLVDGC